MSEITEGISVSSLRSPDCASRLPSQLMLINLVLVRPVGKSYTDIGTIRRARRWAGRGFPDKSQYFPRSDSDMSGGSSRVNGP